MDDSVRQAGTELSQSGQRWRGVPFHAAEYGINDNLELSQSGQRWRGVPFHAAAVVAEAALLGPLGHDQLEAARAASDGRHLLVDLLPDARHAEKHRRTHLLQRLDQTALKQKNKQKKSVSPVFQSRAGGCTLRASGWAK